MSRRKKWLVLISLPLITVVAVGCGSTVNQREAEELKSRVVALQQSLAWTQQQLLSAQAAIEQTQQQNIQLHNEVRKVAEQCSQVQQTISGATFDTGAPCSLTPYLSCYDGYYPYHGCHPCGYRGTLGYCNSCGMWYASHHCHVCPITRRAPQPDCYRHSHQPRSDPRKPSLPDRTKPYNQLILQDTAPEPAPTPLADDPPTQPMIVTVSKSQMQDASIVSPSINTVDPVTGGMQADSDRYDSRYIPRANAISSGITRTQISSIGNIKRTEQDVRHVSRSTMGQPPAFCVDGEQFSSVPGRGDRQLTNYCRERLRILGLRAPHEDQKLETN